MYAFFLTYNKVRREEVVMCRDTARRQRGGQEALTLQEVKGHQQRDSRRQRMQEELQKSRWIFGRRLWLDWKLGMN